MHELSIFLDRLLSPVSGPRTHKTQGWPLSVCPQLQDSWPLLCPRGSSAVFWLDNNTSLHPVLTCSLGSKSFGFIGPDVCSALSLSSQFPDTQP